LLDGVVTLEDHAIREQLSGNGKLYADQPPSTETVEVTAIPYYAWGNRGAGEMQIWARSR
jgi:uncharacterized protein